MKLFVTVYFAALVVMGLGIARTTFDMYEERKLMKELYPFPHELAAAQRSKASQ